MGVSRTKLRHEAERVGCQQDSLDMRLNTLGVSRTKLRQEAERVGCQQDKA